MSVERVKPVEIDLTRHVRTAAGAAYYHRPIGSPIGGSSDLPGVQSMRSAIKAAPKASSVRQREATGTGPLAREARAEKVGLARPTHNVAKSRIDAKTRRAQNVGQVAKKAGVTDKDLEHVRQAVFKHSGEDAVGDSLWQLDNMRLAKAIDDPNTPSSRKLALRREQAFRLAKVKQIFNNPALKRDLDKAGDDPVKTDQALKKHLPAQVAAVMHKFIPFSKKALKADRKQSFWDAVIDWFTKALLTGGAIAVADHTGFLTSLVGTITHTGG